MMRWLTITALGATLALGVTVPAAAQNFITNGGFEDGYTNGNGNYNVPNGWTPNAAFTDYEYSGATATVPHTGSYALTIGNYDSQPLASLSQAFADVVGGIYTVSFYGYALAGGDPNAYLTVSAGSGSVTFLDDINSYTLGTFTFVGTGADALTIAARTNFNTWAIDDVSVTGPAVDAVPEPASWAMTIIGIGAVGAVRRQRRRRGERAFA